MMRPVADLVRRVDVERLYAHVLALAGPRHPIENPDALRRAERYIAERFVEYGLAVREHRFLLAGEAVPFVNVEGAVAAAPAAGELVIGAHHDTVRGTPGANDNLSAVAVMLEAARVLAADGSAGGVRFISFTLEEASPVFDRRRFELARRLGLRAATGAPSSRRAAAFFREVHVLTVKHRVPDEDLTAIFARIAAEMDGTGRLDDAGRAYLAGMGESYAGRTHRTAYGEAGLVGSSTWVADARREGRLPAAIVNLDTIGTRSDVPRSQRLPPGLSLAQFQTFGIDPVAEKGDFLGVFSDAGSVELARSFTDACQDEAVRQPFAHLHAPLAFDGVFDRLPDLLRGDHGPFWRAGVPGLFLCDTGEFRSPFYHTPGDTIDTIDFDFLAGITRALVAFIARRRG